MAKFEIRTEDDARRLTCPNPGRHSSVTPTNDHWLCIGCSRHWSDEIDPEFERVRDAKTGLEYRRDEVQFDADVPGVY